MDHKFLVHKHGDIVGVAVAAIDDGEHIEGVFMDDDARVVVEAKRAVPFGHKIAIANVGARAPVIEYGIRIGVAPDGLAQGDYVHTHNLRSARW